MLPADKLPVSGALTSLSPAASPLLPTTGRVDDEVRRGPAALAWIPPALPPKPTRLTGVPDRVPTDREASAQRLLPLFKLVPEGTPPEGRAPNHLSPTEFSEVVDLFHLLRTGRGSLKIDTERSGLTETWGLTPLRPLPPVLASRFQEGVLEDFATILQTSSGRAVLKALAAAPQPVRIVMAGTDRPSGQAAAVGHNGGPTNVRYVPGISYARADWANRPELFADPYDQSRPSHRVLFHELLHAQGRVYGTAADGAVTAEEAHPQDAGVSLEEYRVVGLGRYASAEISENVYAAERRAIGAKGTGARPGDARMPHRDAYQARRPSEPYCLVARDPVFVELTILSTFAAAAPPAPGEMAWRLVNDLQEVDRVQALTAIEKLGGPAYRAAVDQELLKGRDQLRDEAFARSEAARR